MRNMVRAWESCIISCSRGFTAQPVRGQSNEPLFIIPFSGIITNGTGNQVANWTKEERPDCSENFTSAPEKGRLFTPRQKRNLDFELVIRFCLVFNDFR